VGVVHQPLEVFDERPFVVVAESGFFLEGARAEIVAAIHNQIRAPAELSQPSHAAACHSKRTGKRSVQFHPGGPRCLTTDTTLGGP
jgi:hypothetical protein